MRKYLVFLILSTVFSLTGIVLKISQVPFAGCIEKPFANVSVFNYYPTSFEYSQTIDFFVDGNLLCFRTEKDRVYVFDYPRESNFNCNYTSFNGKILCYEKATPTVSIVNHGEGTYNFSIEGDRIRFYGSCSSCSKLWVTYKVVINSPKEKLLYYVGSARINGDDVSGEGYYYTLNNGTEIYIEKECTSYPCSFEFVIENISLVEGYLSNITKVGNLRLVENVKSNVNKVKVGLKAEFTVKSEEVKIVVKRKPQWFTVKSNNITLSVEWGDWIIFDNISLDTTASVKEPLMIKHEIYTKEGEGIVKRVIEELPKEIRVVNSTVPYTETLSGEKRIVVFELNEAINPGKKIVFTYYITSEVSGEYDLLLGKVEYSREPLNFTLAPHWFHVQFLNVEENETGLVHVDKALPSSIFKGESGEIRFYVDPSLGTPEKIVLQYVNATEEYNLTYHGAGEYSAYITPSRYGPVSVLLIVGNESILLQRIHVNKFKDFVYERLGKFEYLYRIPDEDLQEMEEVKAALGNYCIKMYLEIPESILKDYKVLGAIVTFNNGKRIYVNRIEKIGKKLYITFEDDPNAPYHVHFVTMQRTAPTILP